MPTTGNQQASLYIHVPFCSKKCPYCHFYVVPNKKVLLDRYLEALEWEWQRLQPLLAGKQLVSLYWGGGTPSLLSPQILADWTSRVATDGMEITLEANPEQITLPLLRELKNAGINRLSIGVQSFDDQLLTLLGRTHSSHAAMQAVLWAAEVGFPEISIDLMYEIPEQSLASWRESLKRATELPITHLSFYNLTFEPHTSFYKHRMQLKPLVPAPETALTMLQEGVATLEAAGLKRYEISAFARPGHEALHNSGYWSGRPFLGMGPSAFSYWEGARLRNSSNLHRWAQTLEQGKSPIDFSEKLSYPASLQERLAVELRLLRGVHLSSFEALLGPLPQKLRNSIDQLKLQSLLIQIDERLQLSERGLLFYDEVGAELVCS